MSDYKANLFEIAYLSDEQVKMFKSDFRFVAGYFVGTRKKREGQEPEFTLTIEHLKHVEEFTELMNALTKSDRFSELPRLVNEHGGDTMMTILFDEAEARGKAIGEAIGEARGENRLASLMQKLFALGRNDDAQRAASDQDYRNNLFRELNIQ